MPRGATAGWPTPRASATGASLMRCDETLRSVASRETMCCGLNVPAGRHTAYALTGDARFGSGRAQISVDGVPVASSGEVTIPTGQFRWIQFELDGGSSGRTVDLGLTGSLRDGFWLLDALLIDR